MSSYYLSRYYHSRPSVQELDEMMIEGGLHPKRRESPKLTNTGLQDPSLIASWDQIEELCDDYQEQSYEHTLSLLGEFAVRDFEIDDIIEDTFARYPRLRELDFDIDR